jgi:hypothetical protein
LSYDYLTNPLPGKQWTTLDAWITGEIDGLAHPQARVLEVVLVCVRQAVLLGVQLDAPFVTAP